MFDYYKNGKKKKKFPSNLCQLALKSIMELSVSKELKKVSKEYKNCQKMKSYAIK